MARSPETDVNKTVPYGFQWYFDPKRDIDPDKDIPNELLRVGRHHVRAVRVRCRFTILDDAPVVVRVARERILSWNPDRLRDNAGFEVVDYPGADSRGKARVYPRPSGMGKYDLNWNFHVVGLEPDRLSSWFVRLRRGPRYLPKTPHAWAEAMANALRRSLETELSIGLRMSGFGPFRLVQSDVDEYIWPDEAAEAAQIVAEFQNRERDRQKAAALRSRWETIFKRCAGLLAGRQDVVFSDGSRLRVDFAGIHGAAYTIYRAGQSSGTMIFVLDPPKSVNAADSVDAFLRQHEGQVS